MMDIKKACLRIGLAFITGMGALSLLGTPVVAGELTGVTDTLSDNLAGHTAVHVIAFTLHDDLPKNGHIIIEFPGGFNVSGATLGSNPYSISLISKIGQNVTLKKNTSSLPEDTALSLSLQNIINIQTPGIPIILPCRPPTQGMT